MDIIFKAVPMSLTAVFVGVFLFYVPTLSVAASSQHNNTVTKSTCAVQNFYGLDSEKDILNHHRKNLSIFTEK